MDGENSAQRVVRNLFGEEWYETAGKRGRPPFQWTVENSNKVSMLLACGWSSERIAGCVMDPRTGRAISVPTLNRYFRSELKSRMSARDRLEARRLQRVWAMAEAGNVGAERVFADLLARNDRMEVEREMATASRAAKPERLGKKVIAEQDAAAADAQLMADLEQEMAANARH